MSEERRHKDRDLSGLLFVAFMFLGMGVGFLFDQVASGLFIGMGIGFLAMAVARARFGKAPAEEHLKLSMSGDILGSAITALIGLGFILWGVSMMLGLEIPWRMLGGVFIILFGLWFLWIAVGRTISARQQEAQS